MPDAASILAIRLGALGDILHALPAIQSLKQSFSAAKLSLLIAPRWVPIVEGNPFIDQIIPPRLSAVRRLSPELAFDFQGLLKSALLGRLARPRSFYGFDRSVAREGLAPIFYTHRIPVIGPHRIERNLQLIAAAGASRLTTDAWIPPGRPEGDLPKGAFVLASPLAGWAGKQWPLENYDLVAQILSRDGLEFVINVPGQQRQSLAGFKHLRVHTSTVAGLIDGTRRATAVVGVDSGPLHLAAALHKPGVALYGPTDPKMTGPFGGTFTVIRSADVETTYKRHGKIHLSMRAVTPQQVAEALLRSLRNAAVRSS